MLDLPITLYVISSNEQLMLHNSGKLVRGLDGFGSKAKRRKQKCILSLRQTRKEKG
jgi:hypothetical protein